MKNMSKGNTLLLAMLVAIFSLSSCLKNDSNDRVANRAALSVTNASPDIEKFDFVIGNEKINAGSFDFTQRLPYFSILSGKGKIGIYKDETKDSLLTANFVAETGKIYSLYVVGQAPHHEFLTITDSLSTPSTGKAKVRFINLSLDAPALDLKYDTDSVLFTTVAYKQHSAFVEIPGGKNYNFSISTQGESGTGVSENNVKIEGGKIYTIWAKGYYAIPSADSLKLGIKIQENR